MVWAIGAALGLVEVAHLREMSTTLGITVFAVLPLVVNLGVVGAGYWLLNSRFDGGAVLWVAGWTVVGSVLIGLLGSWTIAHQNIRGGPFVHAGFVTVNNASVGAAVGFVLGWYDALDRHHEEEVASLHEATRELLHLEDREAVARAVAEAARDVLGFPRNAVRLRVDSRLEPVATTARVKEEMGERPTYALDEGIPGQVFTEGDPLVVDEFRDVDDGIDRTPHRSGLYLPIGDHGTLTVADTEPDSFDRSDVDLAQILVNNAASVLDRLERERELARQNERLDEFASVVSHDLRSPLNVLAGTLELAETSGEPVDFERTHRAIDRMDRLIDDLLTLAREGARVHEVAPTGLADLAEDAWRTVETAEADLRVETDAIVKADEGRLRQLLENLFRNAVEHGGEDVAVAVGDLPDGFYVADDGPGIPEDRREAVLEGGYSTSEEGTGFGLAIVESIAEAHDWTTTVTEGEEGGARFEFTGVEFARA